MYSLTWLTTEKIVSEKSRKIELAKTATSKKLISNRSRIRVQGNQEEFPEELWSTSWDKEFQCPEVDGAPKRIQ